MPHFISIQNLQDAGLDIYARLSEVQLLRYREPKPGIFIAESPIGVERALAAGYRPISVLMDEAGVPKQQGLLKVCGEIPVYTARFDVLTQITGFKLTRGMLCAMERNELPQADILCRDMYRIAVLEDVMNPTNVGAIFRSAAALGMDAVLLTHGCADPLYRRAIRVSMGTVFQIPWTYLPKSEEDTAQALHTLGFPCVAMALRDDSCEICDPRFAKLDKLAVILGRRRVAAGDDHAQRLYGEDTDDTWCGFAECGGCECSRVLGIVKKRNRLSAVSFFYKKIKKVIDKWLYRVIIHSNPT